MTVQEYFQKKVNINWQLLKKQKEVLLKMLNSSDTASNFEKGKLRKDEYDTIQGIIYLIDATQDDAVDLGDISAKLVFPDLGTNEGGNKDD